MDSQNIESTSPRFIARPIMVFVAVALVTLLAGKMLFDNLREGIRQGVQRNISAVGALKASQIQDWLNGRIANAGSLSDNSFFAREATLWLQSGGRDDARRGQLVERMQAFLNGHHYRAIVLYDTSGRVMLSVGEKFKANGEVAAQVRRVAVAGETRLVDLYRSQDAALPVGLGFLSPLRQGKTRSGAIYLVENPEQYLFPLLHRWPGDSETAETQLVRIDGSDILFLDQLRYRKEPPLGFRLPLDTPQLAAATALRGKQGLLEHTQDYRGKPVLSYATAIKGTPWVLISKIDEAEAYRMVDQVRLAAGAIALFIFGLFGAWFWQWHRREQEAAEAAILKERVRADALILEGEKRFRLVFEHTALAMACYSLNGEFIEVNNAWCSMLGYSREEVLAQHLSWQQITHAEELEQGTSSVKQLIAGETEEIKLEKRYIRKDGKVLCASVQVSLKHDEKGEPEYFISAIQDITERKKAEQLISFMAYHDKLTGLPNRALLFDRLAHAMSHAKRNAKSVALLFVDLDGFKAINDKYGHEAGDTVLKMAAQRFLGCVRAVDTVSRFGGDEFAIVLGNLEEPQQAKIVAEKIMQVFSQSMILSDGCVCTVGASVGISIYPEHGSTMDKLMSAADHAMYESKRRSNNALTFFRKETPHKDDFQWIKFDDHYLVGVGEIDEQHRNMVYLLNRMNEALQHNETSESIAQIIDELIVATTHHFDTESRYMTQARYPEQSVHEAEHAQLVNEALQFKAQFNQGRELLVLQSIKDWLLEHIIYSDRKLATYLVQHGVK
jgi:diguanylate cyclase (GGDEF)-like protein/PAS domain S-box-containing protein/hemerythrin-like metal-binding protein